jgi:hypothetical protein
MNTAAFRVVSLTTVATLPVIATTADARAFDKTDLAQLSGNYAPKRRRE